MNADTRRLEIENNTFDFCTWVSEVDQQANCYASRFEVIQALCRVDFIQRFNCLEFHDDTFINQEISNKLPNHDLIILDFDSILLLNAKPSPVELDDQSVFIHLFDKTTSQRITNGMNATDDFLRYLI